MTRSFIAVVCASLALACATPVRERCRFINEHVPRPPMPAELAQLDRALIHRATDFTLAVRRLKRLPTQAYQRDFAETLLPALCERMERARGEAAAGHVQQAGAHYQSLLVGSQVLGLEVALLQVADYADQAGQPTAQIAETLWRFDVDMTPLWAAALSEDPGRLAGEMPNLVARYNAWLKLAAEGYRARQRALIEAGKFREAQQMDIDDVRRLFGTKYDGAIREMLEYTETIPPERLLKAGLGK